MNSLNLKRKLQISLLILIPVFIGLFFIRFEDKAKARSPFPENSDTETVNHLPEIADLRHATIGLGQRLTFGLEVIDEEGDNIRIELAKKPASAKFNQNTLTVDWTPNKSDGKAGKFLVKVTELPGNDSEKPRIVTKEYSIEIVNKPVTLDELPLTSLEVDALISVIDPDRLVSANKRWDIVSLFEQIGRIESEKQIKPGSGISPTNGGQLFRDALKELSVLHKNPRIDPDSKQFDPVWNAGNWKLTAVRPRINKKVFELRLVYFNVRAAEQVYLMPRMRIIRGDDAERPDDLRQKNNYTFAKMFHEAFFDGQNLKGFVRNDKAAYGVALTGFITKVLTYVDPREPMMKANFAALPHNSRLGGGNVYGKNGEYLYGDGWGLGALLVTPVERQGKRVLAFTSPPIAGFVASIKEDAEGGKYKTTAAPVADKNNPAYLAGWDTLYDAAHGTVHIPDVKPDGKVEKANLDSMAGEHDYKFKYMVAETKLRDPRRRLFEEKGMTCIQCHVRNFDEGDYLANVQKPDESVKNVVSRPIPRVFFVIVPTLHLGRNEYIHREEQEQLGNLKGVFRDYLGIKVNIVSPLSQDWVHSTKKGRS